MPKHRLTHRPLRCWIFHDSRRPPISRSPTRIWHSPFACLPRTLRQRPRRRFRRQKSPSKQLRPPRSRLRAFRTCRRRRHHSRLATRFQLKHRGRPLQLKYQRLWTHPLCPLPQPAHQTLTDKTLKHHGCQPELQNSSTRTCRPRSGRPAAMRARPRRRLRRKVRRRSRSNRRRLRRRDSRHPPSPRARKSQWRRTCRTRRCGMSLRMPIRKQAKTSCQSRSILESKRLPRSQRPNL